MYRFFLTFLMVLVLSGCISTYANRGYNIEKLQKTEDLIKPGVTTEQEVAQALGSPSVTSSFGDKTWYYISAKTKSVAFLQPKVIEQNIIAIRFNQAGVVSDFKKYNQNDMRELAFKKDYTPAEGNDLTVMQQLLGNVGRFNPAEGSGIPGAPSRAGTGTGL